MTTTPNLTFPVSPDFTLANNTVNYPLVDAIQNRKSIRAFATKAIDTSTIDSLFEAARWRFSASNDQPWVYLYATPGQPALWNTLLQTLVESNRIWASHA
jgi:hypothetical protein